MKRNNGISLISIILFILIILLITFLLYEILHVDIFNIFDAEASVLNVSQINNEVQIYDNDNQNLESENVEAIRPIINNNLR